MAKVVETATNSSKSSCKAEMLKEPRKQVVCKPASLPSKKHSGTPADSVQPRYNRDRDRGSIDKTRERLSGNSTKGANTTTETNEPKTESRESGRRSTRSSGNSRVLKDRLKRASATVECPICFEMYDDDEHAPCTLPCGHSMCLDHAPKMSHCCVCRSPIDPSKLSKSFALVEAARAVTLLQDDLVDGGESEDDTEEVPKSRSQDSCPRQESQQKEPIPTKQSKTKTGPNEQAKSRSHEQAKSRSHEQPKSRSHEQPKCRSYERPKSRLHEKPKSRPYEQPRSTSYEGSKTRSHEQAKTRSQEQARTRSQVQPTHLQGTRPCTSRTAEPTTTSTIKQKSTSHTESRLTPSRRTQHRSHSRSTDQEAANRAMLLGARPQGRNSGGRSDRRSQSSESSSSRQQPAKEDECDRSVYSSKSTSQKLFSRMKSFGRDKSSKATRPERNERSEKGEIKGCCGQRCEASSKDCCNCTERDFNEDGSVSSMSYKKGVGWIIAEGADCCNTCRRRTKTSRFKR